MYIFSRSKSDVDNEGNGVDGEGDGESGRSRVDSGISVEDPPPNRRVKTRHSRVSLYTTTRLPQM